MENIVGTMNFLEAAGSVVLGLVIIVTLLTRMVTGAWFPASINGFVQRHALYFIAGWTTASVVLSFWYSDVVGYVPCPLCWLARTMMFPLAVISIIAAWRRDNTVWPYMIGLSVVGMLITGYHHLYQVGIVAGTACQVLEGAGDCAKRYVFEFGFVTVPFMAFVLFAATALLAWIARDRQA